MARTQDDRRRHRFQNLHRREPRPRIRAAGACIGQDWFVVEDGQHELLQGFRCRTSLGLKAGPALGTQSSAASQGGSDLRFIWPWQDRSRQFSWLKASTFALILVPAI